MKRGSSFTKDYLFGMKSEVNVLNTVKNYFSLVYKDDNIIKVNNKYCKYDFKGDKFVYELKSRNNCRSEYPTTIIPFDKILQSDKLAKDQGQIFLFNFIDGLYYIIYDKDVFKDFELKMFGRTDRLDINDKKKLYYYIPVQKLISVEDKVLDICKSLEEVKI